jgi:catechol 2,3-dioxygenase-like lactoylglutathione lyase family enzyme
MSVATVNGVVETALYVSDLDRSQNFYQRVFGFPEIFRESGRLHALGVAGKQVLLLFRKGASTQPVILPGGRIPSHDGQGTSSVDAWRQRLIELNIPLSSEVSFPGGGHSLYFRDPDDHVVELVTPGVWSIY